MVLRGDVFVECNAMALELFGCSSRDELVGQSPHKLSPLRQPDEQYSADKAREKIEAAMRDGPQRFPWLHTRCDGTLFHAEVALNRVDVEGEKLLVGVVRDITRRKQLEDAVHNIAAGISAATGQEYFNLLVRYVARALDASCAFVGELVSGDTIRTVSMVIDEQLCENIDYQLTGTPCQAVVGSRLCLHARNVLNEFPADAMLRDLQAESYIGVPLFDSNRQPLGLLAAVRRAPIEDSSFAEYIMRIFAARTSGELERKRSLQKLIEEKRLTETIVNSLPGIFYTIDSQGNTVYRNKTLLEAIGLEANQPGIPNWESFVLEQDKDAVRRSMQEVFDTGSSRVELRAEHADGTLHHYFCTGARVEIDGSPHIVGAGVDITELKEMEDALSQSERDFRMIFENAPVGIFRSTVEGQFLLCNSTVAKMLGYDSPEELIANVTDIAEQLFVHKELRAEFVDRVLASDGFLHIENDYRRRDGSEFVADLYMGACREEGAVQFLEGFVEDIDDRKQAEADKRKFYRETILSVTDGKLIVCDVDEMEPYIASASFNSDLRNTSDLAAIRGELRGFFAESGLSGDRLADFMGGVGEVTANAVKHADGGLVFAGTSDDTVWMGVADQGTGIEQLTLPRAVLFRGFSTKPSLGVGYTVILDVSDRVMLSTGRQGTTAILLKQIIATPENVQIEHIPDTWESLPI